MQDDNPHAEIRHQLKNLNSFEEKIDYLGVIMGNISVMLEIILEDMPETHKKIKKTIELNYNITFIR